MTLPAPDFMRISRRAFLGRAGLGVGSLALSALLRPDLFGARAAPPHHAPKAKRVIYLYMAGGPSHLETFDYKPKLAELHGKPIPPTVTRGRPLSPLGRSSDLCVAPQTTFAPHGQSGQVMASLFPKLAGVADELCVVRSLHTDTFVHDPAHTLMCTGSTQPGRPSLGSWVWYGLGGESANLPGFVVLLSLGKLFAHPLTKHIWHSGFLPAEYQGVEFRSRGDPVLYLSNRDSVTPGRQRDVVDAVQRLDRLSDDPGASAHVSQYELAFRMQTSVPELVDFSGERAETLRLYGVAGLDGSFAANCLLARRLAERGVRFIQLVHLDWDHHNKIRDGVRTTAAEVDQGMAALLGDLKRLGLLTDTLVVWGGEFGRTPFAQSNSDNPGRDHHRLAFSMWLAGGGVKAGHSHGATDDFGFDVAENPVHVHDLHATLLHLLGVDHERLTYRHEGRDFRLTDTAGRVVEELLA
jgi:hypothetical protein